MSALRLPVDAVGKVPANTQTQLASFLAAAHTTHAQLLQAVEMQPFTTPWHNLFHSQYWREVELVQLLMRAVSWTPSATAATTQLQTMPFWLECQREVVQAFWLGPMRGAVAMCVLGHAIYTTMRLGPLLPPDHDALDPFALALQHIDQQAGQLVQTQIRFLKNAPHGVPPADAARDLERVRDKVAERWQALVTDLAA